LKKVERVRSVAVTRRGEAVASLSALKAKETVHVEDHPAFGM
jgi:antitoxin (DNA-binding transcriptional repressor) of toxin-antitoxin stability system